VAACGHGRKADADTATGAREVQPVTEAKNRRAGRGSHARTAVSLAGAGPGVDVGKGESRFRWHLVAGRLGARRNLVAPGVWGRKSLAAIWKGWTRGRPGAGPTGGRRGLRGPGCFREALRGAHKRPPGGEEAGEASGRPPGSSGGGFCPRWGRCGDLPAEGVGEGSPGGAGKPKPRGRLSPPESSRSSGF